MPETEMIQKSKYGVLLMSLYFNSTDADKVEKSLDELRLLVETALSDEQECKFYYMTQCRPSPEAATYIGAGKAKEAAELCSANDISLVVFDYKLSPSQIKNLENEIGQGGKSELRVIDRTMLILDIFAKHAVTGEGKLQVEIAQLRYTSPRLTGKGIELSRQGGSAGGSVGARGPGETKLETDRRHIKRRIAALEEALTEFESNRDIMRSKRTKSNIPNVAIVGYTNAGKSTLLNYLTNAGVLSENKLFATLDPTVRKLTLPSGLEILLTDTVGFINNLPHGLVKAFRSTLDEAKYADLLLILIDSCDENAEMKKDVTEKTLADLDAGGKPTVYVFNKCDMLDSIPEKQYVGDKKAVFVSAKTGYGIESLLEIIEEELSSALRKVKFLFPFDVQAPLNNLYKTATVLSVDYTEDGSLVEVLCSAKQYGMYKDYLLDEYKPQVDEE